jgi:hydrogenase nickel incorporation protein HypA/HybF
MHELAICQALMGEVLAIAGSNNADSVTDVYVSVGPLSGVERQLMRSAFPVAAAGTVASQAELHMQQTPVTVRCDECGAETEVATNRLVCGDCGNWRTQLISGDELVLQRVQMTTDRQEELSNV